MFYQSPGVWIRDYNDPYETTFPYGCFLWLSILLHSLQLVINNAKVGKNLKPQLKHFELDSFTHSQNYCVGLGLTATFVLCFWTAPNDMCAHHCEYTSRSPSNTYSVPHLASACIQQGLCMSLLDWGMATRP